LFIFFSWAEQSGMLEWQGWTSCNAVPRGNHCGPGWKPPGTLTSRHEMCGGSYENRSRNIWRPGKYLAFIKRNIWRPEYLRSVKQR